RDRQRPTGKARLLFAPKFVVSASDPLHRRGAWFHHRRSGCNSRLGGPVLSRLALAIGCAAAPFSSAPDPRISIAMADLEIWREVAADVGQSRVIRKQQAEIWHVVRVSARSCAWKSAASKPFSAR